MMASQPTFRAYKSTSVVGLAALLVSCAYVAPRRTTCMPFLRFCCNCETSVSLDVPVVCELVTLPLGECAQPPPTV